MTKQELIEKLESEEIPISVFGVDVDPLVVEGKLNLILKYLKEDPALRGTDVMVNGVYQEIINLVEDPQTQLNDLENYCKALEGTKADDAQLQEVINSLADKANVGTEKETTLSVSTLSEFQDHFYQLRKLPSRSYQYEVSSSLNLDLMDVLGWPNGNGNQAFIYVDLPYNESGGFEIDITYMERYHNNMYKRTMTSTNNGNWQDTGWTSTLENKTEIVKLWEGNAKTISVDATNYDFLIVTINFSNINISNSFYNLKYNKPVGVLDTTHKNDNTQYAARYFYDANSKELKLLRIGFYTDNIYTDRLSNADYSILSIYGIKGVQQ